MTQKQKFWHRTGIFFLVLSVLCIGLYAWIAVAYSNLETPTPEGGDPLAAAGAALYGFVMVYGCVLGSLILSVLGAILALGTSLLCANKPWKIAGYCGIGVHLVLLALFFVRYGEFLKTLFFFGI